MKVGLSWMRNGFDILFIGITQMERQTSYDEISGCAIIQWLAQGSQNQLNFAQNQRRGGGDLFRNQPDSESLFVIFKLQFHFHCPRKFDEFPSTDGVERSKDRARNEQQQQPFLPLGLEPPINEIKWRLEMPRIKIAILNWPVLKLDLFSVPVSFPRQRRQIPDWKNFDTSNRELRGRSCNFSFRPACCSDRKWSQKIDRSATQDAIRIFATYFSPSQLRLYSNMFLN